MLVRDVLKSKARGVIVIGPGDHVRDAVHRLVEHNIGSLPVVDEIGRPLGIFTERDVLYGVARDCDSFGRARVAEVMTPNPLCCALNAEVHEVMGLMSERRVGQLPVLDNDGRVIGVVSVGDLVKILHEHAESENRQLLAYIHGGTGAASVI
jgi:CBS domain-containing protein